MKIKDAATEFLQQKRIAVTGVSGHPEGHGRRRYPTPLRWKIQEEHVGNESRDG